PVPGWTGEYDWTGLVPAEANPNALDPPGGVVENSNDRPSSDPRSAGYAGEWDPGFRGAYLTQRLGARDTWDLAATRVLQTDFASAPAARFREVILAPPPRTDLQRRAQQIVRDWTGVLGAESAGAAIYESWLVHMLDRTFRDKLGDTLYTSWLDNGRSTFALYELVQRPDDPWFVTLGDRSVRGRDALSALALGDAVTELGRRFGADPSAWRWGDVHTITFAHPLGIGPLALLLSVGPLKRPGDENSVNKETFALSQPYAVITHPSERGSRPTRRAAVHARHLADDVPRPPVDDAPVRRLRHGRGIQHAVPLPAEAGADRALRRVRPADADGLRRGRSAGRRRGGEGGRFDQLARRPRTPLRRDPARRGDDVDDDQRDRADPPRD